MRPVRLARAAAEAESLRLRRLVRRQVLRAVYGVVALVFLIATLAMLHVIGVYLLIPVIGPLYALLIIGGCDLLLLLIFGLMAASSRPGAVERDALALRQQATAQLGRDVATWATLRPLLRMLPGRHLYSLVLAGLTARHLSRR